MSVSSRHSASNHSFRRISVCRWILFAFACFAWPLHGFSQLYISEFLADNQVNSVLDEDGDHSDWLEVWNSGPTAVSLNGWYLTDDLGDLRKWRFPISTPAVNVAAGGRLLIYASGKDRKLLFNRLHTNFKLTKNAGGDLALVRPDGLTIEHSYIDYPQQIQDIAYGLPLQTEFQTLVAPGASGKAIVPTSAADMSAGWNGNGAFDDSTWQSGATGFGYDTANTYGALIGAGGDLQGAMHGINSTALIRIPFTVSNPSSILSVRLSMKYDDGYICYLNGTQIAISNAPASPQYNSGAVTDRAGSLTNVYEVVTPLNAQTLLVNGTNMLAFQLLNNGNGSDPGVQDLDDQGTPNGYRTLCLPLLEANVPSAPGASAYLQTPTPNAANTVARTTIGPLIRNTTDTAIRPAGGAASAPIVITTTVVPSLRPLATTNPVLLRYRIAYNGEQIVAMRDDGVAPDTVAGDGIFAGQIPTTTLAPGQMLRWRVSASDSNASPSVSTDPPYLDILDNDQYYGTVAQDAPSQGIADSNLPILHWFVQDGNASRTEGGTRCSLYYLGKFYDNVYVNLHGQSSSGFPTNKKSHDFNFNEDNRFTWKAGEPAQRAINLLTNYADKAKVRNTLAWESWATSSHLASHYSFPIRVQQNGSFWGVYDMVENGDEDFLDRCGLDMNGAFYKVYNSLENSTGVEKKTRKNESNADLQALITALDTAQTLSNRRKYSYDNVDVPTLVNYLANNIVILNNDFGHKNYYMYRDTNGTREWSVFPWDEDLAFGHTWTSTQNYFNDDIHTQKSTSAGAELVLGAAPGNRLMNLIMNTSSSTMAPEMVQMFLRRVRSLMDKDLVSATETNGPWEQRINQVVDLIDPPGATFTTDGDRDLQLWGYWLDGSGTPISAAGQDAATHDHGIRKQALRILSSNPNPPYPSSASNLEGLNNTIPPYLPGRRTRLFNGGLNLIGFSLPTSQTPTPTGLVIETVDFNPGNQDQEYFIIRNNSGTYVDLSDWKITGAVEYTFRGGTVLPPFTSGSAINAPGDVHIGRLHVARNPFGFRNRTVSPKGNEFRLVVGGYKGQLSARGETINLVKPGATPEEDVIVATTTYAPNPTATQNFLRVTELNYNPVNPTPAEQAALPGIQASDFEFIELTNTDVAPLNLAGAYFDKGVTFTFPAGFTLQPGQRCVVVALLSAYNLRYGSSGAIVAGEYQGNLSNSGETIQILDVSGETVLEFDYNPDWYGIPDVTAGDGVRAVQGYSLVTRSQAPAWDSYENPLTWALGGTPGGTPGTNDTGFSNVYIGWAHDHFTPIEENSGLSAAGYDADTDSNSNFTEYSFGGDPRSADPAPALARAMVSFNGQNYPAVRFPARTAALDVTWVVQASTDGTVWRNLGPELMTRVPIDPSLDQLTVRDSEPAIAGSRMFRVYAQYMGAAAVTPTLTIENHAPVTTPDTATAHSAAVTIPVIGNDTDSDTDTLALRSVGTASHGNAVANGDGTVTFTPDATFASAGSDSFTYITGDAFGSESQGTVTVTLVNAVPAAAPDVTSVHSSPVLISVLTNDTDTDNDPLTISGVTQGVHGSVAINGSNVTYTPAASLAGAGTDSFTYTIADGFGGTANGSVTVNFTNAQPVALNDTANVHFSMVSINVLTNDTDTDNDTLAISGITQGVHGAVATNGSNVTYTPSASFAGAGTDSFSYTITDGLGGTANGSVTVNFANTPPVALSDSVVVRPGAFPVAVLGNDNDGEGDSLSVTAVTQGSHGTVALDNGAISYTAGATFNGSDSFTYTVGDGFGGSAVGTVNVTNNAPQAVDDRQRVADNSAVVIAVTGNDQDPDPSQVLSVTVNAAPSAGTAVVEGTSVRYTPGAAFTGTDTFSYTINDGFGGTASAEVRIVNELLASKPGTYLGLVGGDPQASVGISQLRLSKKGRFTGQVWYLGERHNLKQLFAGIGTSDFTIVSKSGQSRQLSLQLDSAEDGMTGTLTDGSTTYDLKLKRVQKIYSKSNPCPQAGAYTVLLPPDPGQIGIATYPQGYGSATMAVSATGGLKAAATLGDGTRAVLKSSVDGQAIALLHAPLYRKPKGFICGKIEFVSGDPEADSRGTLTWSKPAQTPPDATYPSGFTGTTEWMAARYTKLAKGAPIFGAGVTAATATLEFGGLESPIQKAVSLLGSAIQVQATGTDILTLAISPASGRLTGKYTHPRDLKKRPISGVLYQKQLNARGMFNGIDETGKAVTGHWLLAP
jgi:hypothetical protein